MLEWQIHTAMIVILAPVELECNNTIIVMYLLWMPRTLFGSKHFKFKPNTCTSSTQLGLPAYIVKSSCLNRLYRK